MSQQAMEMKKEKVPMNGVDTPGSAPRSTTSVPSTLAEGPGWAKRVAKNGAR